VLDGDFLALEGTAKAQAAPMPSPVTLSRVSTILTGHLVWLRASREAGKNGRGLVPTQVSPTDCLFASLGGNSSLVHLDNVNQMNQMSQCFSWQTGQNNIYSNYKDLLDQRPSDEEAMPPPAFGRADWERLTQERARFETLRFPGLKADSLLTKAVPADFRIDPAADSANSGVNVNEVPTPYSPSAKPAGFGSP
jgi:hypothetical protein